MKYLESVKLVQFFLFEKQEIRIAEVTGIFGPNGSGKSTLIDAIQIAMFGANSRLVNLNAQADEKHKMERSIRSYCLGSLNESSHARENATTYITMIWRDSITKEPLSMGVCLNASVDRDGLDVRGRYIVPGIELSMHDHIEMVNGEEHPRPWEAFRHQLIERAKVSGEEPIYTDSERFIKAALFALKGSGGMPNTEAFKSAFKFALRMRFDKSVDHIVRHDVLEARPTNIQKFKEVTESVRQLKKIVDEVKNKIEDGEKVEAEFAKAAAASVRAITWDGLNCLVGRETAGEAMNLATESKQEAESALQILREKVEVTNRDLEHAKSEEKLNRELRVNHPAHKEHGELQGDIGKAKEAETKRAQEVQNGLNLFKRTLSEAAKVAHLDAHAASIIAVIKSIDTVLPTAREMQKEQLANVLKPVVKQASAAYSALFEVSRGIAYSLSETEKSLKTAKDAALRVNKGHARLEPETERLASELRDHGLNPIPVCDLIRISKPEWQPVIEAYLGMNVEALLVEEAEEKNAFSVYRGMTGQRAVYGVKIVGASKQKIVSSAPGTVAELIEGKHQAAVSYLRKRFGDMMCAETDAEAMAWPRSLTKDGMLSQHGEYERLRLRTPGSLKIGGGDKGQKELLTREILRLEGEVHQLTKQQEEISILMASLMQISNEDNVLKVMLEACQTMHEERSRAASLILRMSSSADAEYARLGELEQKWIDRVSELGPEVVALNKKVGGAETTLETCRNNEAAAIQKWEAAKSAVETAIGDKEYDADYASKQWDALLDRFGEKYSEMAEYCARQAGDARTAMNNAVNRGVRELTTFRGKYNLQGMTIKEDWCEEREWMNSELKRLRETDLVNYQQQMMDAYKASQETFRADVAIALSNNIDHLNGAFERLNRVLGNCPVFSNGERYQFVRKVRPQLQRLLTFVKDIAVHGPGADLFGGAGEIPEEFQQLLDDKVAPTAAGMQSPLDDYREFFEFDIEIMHEDSMTKELKKVGTLSKRLGTGSGGEHRAPLYVIAGAALASAYRLDGGHVDGIRLILLDEAFNKMDTGNIVATMRYLEQLGLQVFMASPGENLGTLNAYLHRYYNIIRDAENSAVMIQGHDVTEQVRQQFRSDLAEFNEELVAMELADIRAARATAGVVA